MQYGSQNRQSGFRRVPASRVSSGGGRGRQSSSFRVVPVMTVTLILGIIVVSWIRAEAMRPVLETEARMLGAEITAPLITGPKIQPKRLEAEIGALLKENEAFRVSVAYRDLTRNRTFHYGSKSAFTAASVGKLITAAKYLDDVDKGKRSLNEDIKGASAREHLEALIEVSDNQSWIVLNQALGYDALEAYATRIGIKDYDSWENTLPAEGVAVLLQKLYERQLLSTASTDLLLGHLERANYRQYIVAAVPVESTVYHKVGYLEDRAMDAAIIDNGRHPYVLVIFTEAKNGSYNFTAGTRLIKDITQIIHQGYER